MENKEVTIVITRAELMKWIQKYSFEKLEKSGVVPHGAGVRPINADLDHATFNVEVTYELLENVVPLRRR